VEVEVVGVGAGATRDQLFLAAFFSFNFFSPLQCVKSNRKAGWHCDDRPLGDM
jgi:hypothetical protein